MRVAAVSVGTEGDVRPFVALGRALAERGHSLVLAVDASGAALAAEHGIEHVALPGGLRELITGDGEMGRFVRGGSGVLYGIAPVRRLLAGHLHQWTTALLDAAPDADLVLSSGLSLPAGFTAAERLDKPVAAVVFQPFAPSRELAAPVLPPRIPLRMHAPLFQVGNQVTWLAFRDLVNDSRRRLGLPPRRQVWRDFAQVGAWSPTLVPRPRDWPGHIVVTGDWPLAGGEPLDEELAGFLAEGEPPVHVGFGSMATPDGLLDRVVAALDGRRAVLSVGWQGQVPERLPADVHVTGHVPHHLVLPRVAFSVHHCGAGTSHAAVRAGVPSVGVPVTADQPFWAEQLHRRGLASRPVAARRATTGALRRAFAEAEECGPAADAASARMTTEDGATSAVDRLEQLLP